MKYLRSLLVLSVFAILAIAMAARTDTKSWPIVVAPGTILPGDRLPITVTMNQTVPANTTVTLSSSHPDLISVPSSFTVTSGTSQAVVEATIIPPSAGKTAVPTTVTFTASTPDGSAQGTYTLN